MSGGGTQSPLWRQILADVFDALLSERPYKKPWKVDQAVELIRSESGGHFDPACVEAMLERLDEIIASRSLPQAMDGPQRG